MEQEEELSDEGETPEIIRPYYHQELILMYEDIWHMLITIKKHKLQNFKDNKTIDLFLEDLQGSLSLVLNKIQEKL